MRIMVIFDLPVVTKRQRKSAASFRRDLLNDGFEMLQYSVYTRLCPNRDNAKKHLSRIKKNAPENGSIRFITITENQYANMAIISGEKTSQEKHNAPTQLAFF